MNSASLATSSRDPRRARLAVSAIFLINGFALASWISRIPAITDKLDLSNGEVGTVLMSLAVGAIIAFPFAGRLIDSRSSAVATQVAAVVLFAALPFAGLAPQMLVLMAALAVFGAANGAIDVSMNAQGVEVERFCGRPIMSSLHGFFSVGAFLGASAGAGAAALDLAPAVHFLIVSVTGLIVLWRVRGWLIPDFPDERKHEDSPAFVLPHRSIWALGALLLCVSVSEGAMADWTGLYLHEELGTSTAFAALGFAVFSVCMVTGRFSGDFLANTFGPVRLIRVGCGAAAIGLAIALVLHDRWAMLAGFGVMGLGLAAVYPLVFSAAGNHPTLSRGRAVAGVATLGYSGFLAGPPVLGWIAEFTSLRTIMALLVVLTVGAVLLAGNVKTAGQHASPGPPNQ